MQQSSMRGTHYAKRALTGLSDFISKNKTPEEMPIKLYKNYTKEKRNYQHLNVEEREIISIGLASNKSIAKIGKELERHRSTILREIRRNNAQVYKVPYRAHRAQRRSEEHWKESHRNERLINKVIWNYTEDNKRGPTT